MSPTGFARAFARVRTPVAERSRWLAFWLDALEASPGWRYRHPGGGSATFHPSPLTGAVLRELVEHADEDGFAEVAFADLAQAVGVPEPADLGQHVRALRHLGIVERYTRPAACNPRRRAAADARAGRRLARGPQASAD